MEIITGYTGKPHVTAEQDRDVNEGIFDTGSFVLKTGSQLAAELVSNNEIKVRDGVLVIQGCTAVIKKNTYDPVTIANGSQGMKRIDLIVARYNKNEETKIEEVMLKVIQGTPNASTAAVPTYKTGDIQSGDLVADMPLYKVTLDGLNVTSVDKMFTVIPTLPELSSNLTKANNILTNMESNLMAINTYHMTLNTSNVKTSDSWIECNRIGNLVMVNGCVKITKDVNVYTGINLASGAPAPCCDKQLYTGAIAQDNTYSSCLLSVSKNGEINLYVRWKKALAGDVFYYEFCYICK
jgi:hypothetical protein